MQAVMELQFILVAEDVRPSVMRPVPELIMERVTTVQLATIATLSRTVVG